MLKDFDMSKTSNKMKVKCPKPNLFKKNIKSTLKSKILYFIKYIFHKQISLFLNTCRILL